MTSVATTIIVLSSSLFTASLIKMFAPSGGTEKILRLIISMFVIICMVTCIRSVVSSVKISRDYVDSDIESSNIDIKNNVLKVTGDFMVEYTDKLLNSNGVNANKIKLTVDSDENDVINITELSIYLDKDDVYQKQQVAELLENDLNVTPSIIFED